MKNVKNYLVYASCIVAIAFSAASFAKVYALLQQDNPLTLLMPLTRPCLLW